MLKLHHFAFEVFDLNRSIDFYSNTLGLKLLFRADNEENDECFAFLEFEGGSLELLQIFNESTKEKLYRKPEIRHPYSPHIAFGVDSVDEKVSELRRLNVEPVKGPLVDGNIRWVYFSDPDGNIIEFIQGM